MNAITFCIVLICIIFQCITEQGMVDAFHIQYTSLTRPAVIRSAPLSNHATGAIRTTTTKRIINHQYHHQYSSALLANKKENKEGGESSNNLWNGIVELWDEIIEVSTYGPSERKMLKAQRERQKIKLDDLDLNLDIDVAGGDNQNNVPGAEIDMNDDRTWMDAFAAAKDSSSDENVDDRETLDYDGYAMQDLLLSKWGISLDLDFQRIGKQIYCTILPQVGYGSGPLKSRHESELNYLMHLQGVVEILHKYDKLEDFISFVETTKKVPKRGTDSVPYRLNLSDEDIERIMQT